MGVDFLDLQFAGPMLQGDLPVDMGVWSKSPVTQDKYTTSHPRFANGVQ